VDLDIRPRAIVRANDLLFLGGTPYSANRIDLAATYEGTKGGLMSIMSTSNGEKIAGQSLDSPPVWDGMAAANGRLYISLESGNLLSLK